MKILVNINIESWLDIYDQISIKGNKTILVQYIRNNQTFQGLPLPSTGQTIMNFLLVKHKIEKKILPEIYNLGDLHRKNLLHMPGQSWWPDELTFLQAGWIYHFAAIPGKGQQPRHVEYWMQRTYEELYG